MRLYQVDYGVYPRRVIIYLAEKGITGVEQIEIKPGENREDWFLKMNPAGTIPTLQNIEGNYITQTASIIEYLEEKFPEPNMIGKTPEERAVTRDHLNLLNIAYGFGFSYVAHASAISEGRERIAAILKHTSDPAAAAAALGHEYRRQLGCLETILPETPYMGGETPSIADVTFFASAQYLDLFYGERMADECPKLKAIYERFSKRPSATPPQYPQKLNQLASSRQ